MAYPSPAKRLCLFMDASSDFWSAVCTQVEPSTLALPFDEQEHEPLAFLSGKFIGAERRWPIIEKEAFAIVAACQKLDWLLQCPQGFSLFTDHKNLLYVFNLHVSNPNIAGHTAAKLVRWALKLSAYRYKIEHIPGHQNVWSDMLTRWAAPEVRARISSLIVAPLAP
jgi:RNase H-like domain found in reverse transcriptase